jgi:hypothetical protein
MARLSASGKLWAWLLLAAACWTCGYLVNVSALDSDLAWAVALDRRKGEIAQAAAGAPRVLLVGGSQTHFSVDASQLERESGCRALNLGLHAAVGLNAMLERSLERVARGDLVLLLPEYATLAGDGTQWLTAAFGAAVGRPGIGGAGFEQRARLAFAAGTTSLTSLGKSAWVALGGAAGRSAQLHEVGERGDAMVFLTDQRPTEAVESISVGTPALERIAIYAQELQARGATLVLALPWLYIPESGRVKALAAAGTVAARLAQVAPLLEHSPGHNLQANPDLFSDTNYHASPAGRELHTRRLGAALRPQLAKQGWRCG